MRMAVRPKQQAQLRARSGPQRTVAAQRVTPRLLAPGQRVRALPVFAALNFATPGEEAAKEEGGQGIHARLVVPDVFAAAGGSSRDMGSSGSLGAVMEKSKLSFVMPTPPKQGAKLDDSGNGGDLPPFRGNGGGGGDGGDDDDDDYGFGEDGDGDGEGGEGGDGFWRKALQPLYDSVTIAAVLAEWIKTMADMPAIFRQAVQQGLVSSAMLVRWLSMDIRPNMTRSVYRKLPLVMQRELVGRLMADPGFVQKMVLEQLFTAAASVAYEWKVRGDRFRMELDQVLINTLGVAAASGAAFWAVAPSRTYSSLSKAPWQQMVDKLPNCIFDASTPLKAYNLQQRALSLLMRAGELSLIGSVAGAATSMAAQASTSIRQRMDPTYAGPSVPIPAISSSAGLGAFFGLVCNSRLQLAAGMDRFLMDHARHLWTVGIMSNLARAGSAFAVDSARPWWQGLPSQPDARTSAARRAASRSGSGRSGGATRVVKKKVAAKPADAAAAGAVAVAAAPVAAPAAAEVASTSGATTAPQADAASTPAGVQAPQPTASAAPTEAAAPPSSAPPSAVEQQLRSQLQELTVSNTLQSIEAAAATAPTATATPTLAPAALAMSSK